MICVCSFCEKEFKAKQKRKYCCHECYANHSKITRLGKNNPFWKGGTSPIYFQRIAKDNIIQKCAICFSIEKLEVHHIDFNRKHNELSNLMFLCKSCHSKVHKKEQNFKEESA